MKTKSRLKPNDLMISMTLLFAANGFGQTIYNQATTNNLATWTNLVEKSATTLTVATVRSDVAVAWTNDAGGVLDLPTAVATGTTVYRGTYGRNNPKRMQITSSVAMQNSNAGGNTIIPISTPNVTTSSANQSDYSLALGVFDISTGLPLANEVLKEIGFVIPSRSSAAWPLDLRATVFFSDGTTQAVTSTIAAGRGVDDTFFGFAAPSGLSITNLRLQSFVTTTVNPVADRICWDDFSFITGPSSTVPQPAILNVSPAAYAISDATNGIHFQALTYVSIPTNNISLVVNSNNVSNLLTFSGDPTNYSVAYTGLVPDQEYNITISVTNSGGVASLNRTFYTATSPFVLYDSQGFTNDTLYPVGPLQNVTDGRATWSPNASEPATIVDVGDPQGKVLQRQDTGLSRADFLDFPPVSSGTMTIEFDALASTTVARTFDICIQPLGAGGTTMGSFLAWGEVSGKLAYFDNVNWLPIADLQSGWHHYKILNYLSGPAAGKYDVSVDGTVVAQRLPWRNPVAGSAFSRFRIQSQNTGALFEYGNIDNLVVSAGPPDLNATLSPTILNVTPANRTIILPSAGIQFEVTSGQAISNSDVSLVLDGVPVTLTVTNSATNHLFASYNQLTNGSHTVQINATNAVGSTSVTVSFIATDEAWLIHPGDGWVEPWEWSGGFPELRADDPIDGASSYIRLDLTNATARNFMRQYQSGTVDITKAHYLRWKFRLAEADFASNFTAFNDRAHFFARNAPRLTAGTDAADSWSISATGNEQTAGSGISAGQTFYILDNRDGTGNYNLTNLINTGIQLLASHVYSFEVLVYPQTKTYSVVIVDQTSSNTFTSSVPHRFRDLSETSHTYLHFGVQTASAAVPRAIDLDSVFVSQAPLPVTLINPLKGASTFSFSFLSQTGMTHTAQYLGDLAATNWTALTTVAGDGTTKIITHTNPPAAPTFYRVRTSP